MDLNAEETKKGRYEVRYYVRNAKLFVEVVCLQKGERRGEIVVKDGKTYTVKEKITVGERVAMNGRKRFLWSFTIRCADGSSVTCIKREC